MIFIYNYESFAAIRIQICAAVWELGLQTKKWAPPGPPSKNFYKHGRTIFFVILSIIITRIYNFYKSLKWLKMEIKKKNPYVYV